MKTRVLIKFLVQLDCWDYLNGYSAGGLFSSVADKLAHEYAAFKLGITTGKKPVKKGR